MKKLKRVLCLLCLLLLVIPAFFSVAAAQDQDTPIHEDPPVDLQYIRQADCTLAFSGGNANIASLVKGAYGSTTKCKIQLSLQEKNLVWWSTVESWEKNEASWQMTLTRSYPVVSGKTYRAVAVVTVWNGSNSETTTVFSGSVKAP